MKLLDRNLQRDLLNQMAEAYPGSRHDLFDMHNLHSAEAVNLFYLEEHGLAVIERASERFPGTVQMLAPTPYGAAKITASGMDFLADDGGLSAILGTVTVRLHADTIRDLIEAKIAESEDVPEEDKPALIAALKNMREEGLKQLTQRVVGYGLDQAPGAWSAILNALT